MPLPELNRPIVRSKSRTLRNLRPEIVQAGGIFDERLHRFLPAANRFDGGERLRQPVAQAPRAHRRDGAIDRAVKRGVARGIVMQRLQNFEMPQRRVIQREKIVALIKRQPREMFHVAAQMLREIMQRRARRADGGGCGPSARSRRATRP